MILMPREQAAKEEATHDGHNLILLDRPTVRKNHVIHLYHRGPSLLKLLDSSSLHEPLIREAIYSKVIHGTPILLRTFYIMFGNENNQRIRERKRRETWTYLINRERESL